MTEKEMIEGCVKGNANCQHFLFRQYSRLLMTVCLRYAPNTFEAEDMLQESFIRIFSNINLYKFLGSFEGWLRSITVNTCLRKLQKSRILFSDVDQHETVSDDLNLDAISVISEKELIVLISHLPKGYRIVFNLNVIEGYSHEEIAALLDIEVATSRSQLLKARRLLQKQILCSHKIAL